MKAALALLFVLAAWPLGAELKPRVAPSDYAVQAQAGEITVAADYQFRAMTYGKDTYFLRESLVLEVALFGPRGKRYEVRPDAFSLWINGKEPALRPQSAELTMYADRWGSNPALDIGLGSGRVRIGGPAPEPRFPGDPTSRPRKAPRTDNPTRPKPRAQEPEAILKQAALRGGQRLLPVAGSLYFHYKKKTKSIKKLQLVYRGRDGQVAVLRLK